MKKAKTPWTAHILTLFPEMFPGPLGFSIIGKALEEKNWLLEFDTLNTGVNPLMGWVSSKDTMSEVKLKFSTKNQAINYAKKNNIDYYIIEPQKHKIIKKSYTDNFIKNN